MSEEQKTNRRRFLKIATGTMALTFASRAIADILPGENKVPPPEGPWEWIDTSQKTDTNKPVRKIMQEPAKKISVCGEYDVVVVGGGIAGIAAALAAARNGSSVCLIEKENGLGGLATLGNIVVYEPLCDGMGTQVIKGIGEELLKLSISDGYDAVPECWLDEKRKRTKEDPRYRVQFNPMTFMLEIEALLEKNKVKIMYDTRFCDLIKDGSAIQAIIIENKGGRQAVMGKSFIDTSGDADICFMAGEEVAVDSNNGLASWYYYFDGKKPCLRTMSENHQDAGHGFSGVDPEQVTDFILKGRKWLRKDLTTLRKTNKAVSPLFMSSIPDFRMTRRLRGVLELETRDKRRFYEDSIGMTGDWRYRDPVYFIPLSALRAVKTPNLITAGRCISMSTVNSGIRDVMRVIPACAVTGEAAGTASAMLAKGSADSFRGLNPLALRERLIAQGVMIVTDKKYHSNAKFAEYRIKE